MAEKNLTTLINESLREQGLKPSTFYRRLREEGVGLTEQAVDAWRKGTIVGDAHREALSRVLSLPLAEIQRAASVQARQRMRSRRRSAT
ncbi:MAG: hypothetical protein AAFV53_21045 [Myxococcota bacterium]